MTRIAFITNSDFILISPFLPCDENKTNKQEVKMYHVTNMAKLFIQR